MATRRTVRNVGDRNAGGVDLLNRRNQRLVVDRGEDDRIRLLYNHVLDLRQLLRNAIRLSRDIMNDFDAERFGRRFSSDTNRLEIRVSQILGEHGGGLAVGIYRTGENRRQHGGYTDDQVFHLAYSLFILDVVSFQLFRLVAKPARARVDPDREQNDDAGDERLP